MRTHTRPALAAGALALLLATGCSAPDNAPATPSTTAPASATIRTPAPTTASVAPASTASTSRTAEPSFNTPEAASADDEAAFLRGIQTNVDAFGYEVPAEESLLDHGEMACMQMANGATKADVVVDDTQQPGAEYNVLVANVAQETLCPETW